MGRNAGWLTPEHMLLAYRGLYLPHKVERTSAHVIYKVAEMKGEDWLGPPGFISLEQ